MLEGKKQILWGFAATLGVLVALTLILPASRRQLLELAERAGLWQEEEHELVPVTDEAGNVKYWTCTMHPSVHAAESGKCPICGMDLVPVRESASSEAPGEASEELDYWTCTMHPSVHAAEPGKCPICGMDLVPVRKQTAAETETAGLFTLATERRQLIGVQFTEVAYRTLARTIRTVGRVELDQQKIAQVHPKISGWLEETLVNYQWQPVRKGDPLFTIYSPQLVAAQQELLLALKAREELADENPFPKASAGARSLVEDTRMRLRLWDVTDEQILELERTGQVSRTVTVVSPLSGHVIKLNAFPRMQVTPDISVYTIADHSSIWVHVDVYENEIALVREGQTARMTVPSYPNRVFTGKVTFIWPHLDPATRTLKVRLEFPNPDLALKPEMYADVTLRVPLGRRLVVPKSAVLPTGERNLVFVERGEGRMEIRAVQVGVESDDLYEVVRGLKPGEHVVTAANFLVDAESQVQGAIASWQGKPTESR